jgi:hypothetical protein
MVARLWHGATRLDKADAYVEYLRRTGATECRRAPGNQGVTIFRAIHADRADFLFISSGSRSPPSRDSPDRASTRRCITRKTPSFFSKWSPV